MNINEITEAVWTLCYNAEATKRLVAAQEVRMAMIAHRTYMAFGYKSNLFKISNFRIAMPGDTLSVRRVGQITEEGYLRLMLSDSEIRQPPTVNACTCGNASGQAPTTDATACTYCYLYWNDNISRYSIVREPSPMGYWTYDAQSGSILFGEIGDAIWDGSELLVEYLSSELPSQYPDDLLPIIVSYIKAKSGQESPMVYNNLIREYKLARQPNLSPDAIAESARKPAWIKQL